MEGDTPPTWPNRRPSPPFINPVLLILLIPILTLFLIFLLIPSFVSLTSHITIKPISIKKSWDSLNILLVLVAVICGIVAKRNDNLDQPLDLSDQRLDLTDRWYECSERQLPVTGNSRLRRNSSSYPDLRQASDWDNGYSQLRFFDDSELETFNRQRLKKMVEMNGLDVKVILVDNFGADKSPPASEENQAEHIQLRSVPKQGRKESEIEIERSRNIRSNEKRPKRRQNIRNAIKEPEKTIKFFPPPTPPPPPPPLPPPSFYNIFKKRNKNKRVYSVSGPPPPPPPPPPMSHIFNNMFKTRSKSKRVENPYSKAAPPPPPPPLPPRSIFNNMFKTKITNKRKIKYSTSAPPPPPPPPPSHSIFNNMFKTGNKNKQSEKPPLPPPPPPLASVLNDLFKTDNNRKSFEYTSAPHQRRSGRPPLPPTTRDRHVNEEKDENRTTGAESPLPPFWMSDFVSSSPEREDVDLVSDDKMDGGDRLGPTVVTCPSPDVNTKADSFIARLKGEWKLEKMNSIREKQMSPRNRTYH